MNGMTPAADCQPTDPGDRLPTVIRQEITSTCAISARLSVRMRILNGSRDLGPLIALQGTTVLDGLDAHLLFRRGLRRRPGIPEDVICMPLVTAGQTVDWRGHRMRSEPGATELTVNLADHEQSPLTEEHVLGQPVSGRHALDLPFVATVTATVWVAALSRSDRPGACVRAAGEVSFPRGVAIRLGFRRRAGDQHEYSSDISVVGPGHFMSVAERTLAPEIPEDRWLAARFVGSDGIPIRDEHVVGRLSTK